MRYEAPQYELPLAVQPQVERDCITVDGAAFADRLHELERDGWTVVSVARLPGWIGYSVHVQRKVRTHD